MNEVTVLPCLPSYGIFCKVCHQQWGWGAEIFHTLQNFTKNKTENKTKQKQTTKNHISYEEESEGQTWNSSSVHKALIQDSEPFSKEVRDQGSCFWIWNKAQKGHHILSSHSCFLIARRSSGVHTEETDPDRSQTVIFKNRLFLGKVSLYFKLKIEES